NHTRPGAEINIQRMPARNYAARKKINRPLIFRPQPNSAANFSPELHRQPCLTNKLNNDFIFIIKKYKHNLKHHQANHALGLGDR
ncbi:hypothetical protein L0B80_26190, partial [Ralstonia solanacearum]|nr:hypothetical protein [Ralstonia solanacearum]